VIPFLIALGCITGTILVVVVVVWVITIFRTNLKLQRKRQLGFEKVLDTAEDSIKGLGYPMVLCPSLEFLRMGRLCSYETMRDRGSLVWLDTLEQIRTFKRTNLIIFLSHQWLGWGLPDPDAHHFNAMCAAITHVTKVLTESGGDATLSPERTYIWCDFLSIAQDHRALQVMAVSALTMFSVSSDAFVVIAPPATHLGSGDTCNFESYSLRGWCRAEVLSKICGDGLKRMFVLEDESHTIQPLTEEWLSKLDMAVFHGNFSCCHLEHEHASVCDKETLMPAMLGLYSLMWLRRNEPHMEWVFEYINGAKDYFFPPYFTFKTRTGAEKRELFGPLVSMLERRLQHTANEHFDDTLRVLSSRCTTIGGVGDVEANLDV